MSTLNQHVLVLNRLWQAVNICTVKRAIGLVYRGNAMVVFEEEGELQTYTFNDWRDFSLTSDDEEDCLHTIRYRILIPRIILLKVYDKMPDKEVRFTRHNIYERDKNTCQYCGKLFDRKELNLDHVIPKEMGGRTTWSNIVCSCKACNSKKGGRTPRHAGMRLIRKPKKPLWNPFLSFNLEGSPHDMWRRFIDIAYWNVELGEEKEENK